MKKTTILLTSLLIAFVTGCQDHNLEPEPEDVMAWRAGGPGEDVGQDIAVDQSGNIYVTGVFSGTASFGSTTLTSNGLSDIFIVKYNNKGEVQWAHSAGGHNTDPFAGADRGRGIEVDQNGNVYVTGEFTGTATFGSISLTANGSQGIFITKFNSSGEVQWARSAGGTGFNTGYGIALDNSGNLYVTGSFQGTATFGSTSFTSRGSNDVFITKYNSIGDVLWAQQAGGVGSEGGGSIAVDESGNAYISGTYSGPQPVIFGTITISGAGSFRESDPVQFIAKYSSTGEPLWARRGSTGSGGGIAVDGSGNAYVTGSIYIGAFNTEIYLAKYNTNGEGQWSRAIGAMGRDAAGAKTAVDKTGNVYLIGFILGPSVISPLPFGSGVSINPNLATYSGRDILVAKFDSNGNVELTRSAGGPGNDYGVGIAVDEHGTMYSTGSFEGTATFGTTTLTSGGEGDVFVAKFK